MAGGGRRRSAVRRGACAAVMAAAVLACVPGSALAARGAFWATWVEPQHGKSQLDLLRSLQAQMGRGFHGVRLYHPLDHSRMRSPVLDLMRRRRRPLYLNVSSEVRSDNCVPWRDVARGRYNADLHHLAHHIKRWPAKVFFSWNHEFLNNCTTGTPADYVASYHRIHKLFRHDHVGNVVYVWTATAHNFHQDGALLRQYQPRRYDVVGVDGYNKANDWVSAKSIFQDARRFARRHHKGLMIGEVGTPEDPNDATAKATWIANAAATFKAWRVRMVVWTNTADYWAASSPAAAVAYRAASQMRYFRR
jgi:hypothetical protein